MKYADASHRCFESIVVGIDESEASDAAIAAVLELPVDERQRVLFAAQPILVMTHANMRSAFLVKRLGWHARETLRSAVSSSAVTPHEALLIVAQQQGADIIVLGSHGRRGFQRLLLGSVAERIVRTAPLPCSS